MAVAVTLATPKALVNAVGLDNTALAPDTGTAKVTVMPFTKFPLVSFTVTCSAIGKAAPTGVDCGVPAVGVTLAIPVFVSVKVVESVAVKAVTA